MFEDSILGIFFIRHRKLITRMTFNTILVSYRTAKNVTQSKNDNNDDNDNNINNYNNLNNDDDSGKEDDYDDDDNDDNNHNNNDDINDNEDDNDNNKCRRLQRRRRQQIGAKISPQFFYTMVVFLLLIESCPLRDPMIDVCSSSP